MQAHRGFESHSVRGRTRKELQEPPAGQEEIAAAEGLHVHLVGRGELGRLHEVAQRARREDAEHVVDFIDADESERKAVRR